MSEIVPDHANWRHNKFKTGMQDRRVPVETGGGGPHDPRMEARIAALEVALQYAQRDIAEVRTGVAALQTDTGTLKTDTATLKTQLGHMPTKLELWTAVATGVVAVIGVAGGGLWWVAQTYLGPILEKAATGG